MLRCQSKHCAVRQRIHTLNSDNYNHDDNNNELVAKLQYFSYSRSKSVSCGMDHQTHASASVGTSAPVSFRAEAFVLVLVFLYLSKFVPCLVSVKVEPLFGLEQGYGCGCYSCVDGYLQYFLCSRVRPLLLLLRQFKEGLYRNGPCPRRHHYWHG